MNEFESINKLKTAVLNAQEMKQLDFETTDIHKISEDVLIERAALCVYETVFYNVSKESEIVILVGPGNNGADGICLYRILKTKGYKAQAFLLFDEKKYSQGLLKQIEVAESYGFWPIRKAASDMQEELYYADYIVDAIFGIGLKREIEGDVYNLFCELNRKDSEYQAQRIAIDIPSGIHTDTGRVMGEALRCDMTVSFSYPKRGFFLGDAVDYTGRVVMNDVGIFLSKESALYGRDDIMYTLNSGLTLWPERKHNSDKTNYGKVLIIAGSEEIYGAAYLCAGACFASGAGMVKVVTHAAHKVTFEQTMPQAMFKFYADDQIDLSRELSWADSIIIGPGLGISEMAESLLKQVLSASGKRIVFDADAINLLARSPKLLEMFTRLEAVKAITPHFKEFSRISGMDYEEIAGNPVKYADEFAIKTGAVVVLKSPHTYVTNGKHDRYINSIGNPGMATAGCGDILAGVIGSFLALKDESVGSAFEAIVSGVYMHSKAGDEAMEHFGMRPLTADDILRELKRL